MREHAPLSLSPQLFCLLGFPASPADAFVDVNKLRGTDVTWRLPELVSLLARYETNPEALQNFLATA